MVPPLLRDVLGILRERLERQSPGRIERVVLFGSWARGEADEESDVDVLVVIQDLSSRERMRAIEIGAETGFEQDLVIEPVVLSSAEWRGLIRSERLFASEISREGLEIGG